MPTISYNTIDGLIDSQAWPNGGREEFLPDALGSVVQTTHGTTGAGRTLRYGPYGSTLSDNGAWDVPRFEWVGQWGYRTTNLPESEQYVRARHYSSKRGQWTSVDPLWPRQSAYGYVTGRPATVTDRYGLYPQAQGCGVDTDLVQAMINAFCNALNQHPFRACVSSCIQSWFPGLGAGSANGAKDCYQNWCAQGSLQCGSCSGSACACSPWLGGPKGPIIITSGFPACGSATDPSSWFVTLAHELGHLCVPENTNDTEGLDPGPPPIGGSTGGFPGHACVYGLGDCVKAKCIPTLTVK